MAGSGVQLLELSWAAATRESAAQLRGTALIQMLLRGRMPRARLRRTGRARAIRGLGGAFGSEPLHRVLHLRRISRVFATSSLVADGREIGEFLADLSAREASAGFLRLRKGGCGGEQGRCRHGDGGGNGGLQDVLQ